MNGEWKPPRTFSGMARPPAALTAARNAGICSAAAETVIWPGQLKLTG